MKLKLVLLTLLLMVGINKSFALSITIKIVASESDADIYQDGELMGKGTVMIKLISNTTSTIVVKKMGFFDSKELLHNNSHYPKPEKIITINLQKDDGFDASITTDIANNDIQVISKLAEEKTWKLISEIVYSYFDVVEITDKSSGYLRTAWTVTNFSNYTIRTRIIVRICSSENGLCYKVKLVSEKADQPNTSAKEDEKFKPWDRVLKKYSNFVQEIQSRVN